MAARRTKRDRIVDAAMELASDERWEAITLSQIAAGARLSLADLRREFSSRTHILSAFFARIDAEMLAAASGQEDEPAIRDRLFDLIMCRFDALGPFKPALRNIASGPATGPAAALAGLRRVLQSQRWILDAAGGAAPGLRGQVKTCGLAAIYLDVFSVWLDEDDPGLPRTMARLDRQLRRGEWLLERGEMPISLAGNLVCAITRCARRAREADPAPSHAATGAAGDA
ncbi:MAG: TetR/AcrR family transcriptional regulator [Rhizobiales bacterium]|nr:TetR/AcrR family transcriptional regulator [Hyphomicrobiales bacterium]